MASDMQHAPVASPTRQRVAAWIALGLSLIFPLIVAFNAIVIQTQNLSNGGSIVVESLYSAFTYFVWPLPIIAIFLASLVLRDAKRRNKIAWAAIILGVLSILAIAGVIIFLAFFAHGQSASSSV